MRKKAMVLGSSLVAALALLIVGLLFVHAKWGASRVVVLAYPAGLAWMVVGALWLGRLRREILASEAPLLGDPMIEEALHPVALLGWPVVFWMLGGLLGAPEEGHLLVLGAGFVGVGAVVQYGPLLLVKRWVRSPDPLRPVT